MLKYMEWSNEEARGGRAALGMIRMAIGILGRNIGMRWDGMG